MRRMQRHERQLPRLDALDQHLTCFLADFVLTDVAPPDQDLRPIQIDTRQSLLIVVEAHTTGLDPIALVQISGDRVAQKVLVSLFLTILLTYVGT